MSEVELWIFDDGEVPEEPEDYGDAWCDICEGAFRLMHPDDRVCLGCQNTVKNESRDVA